MKVGRVQFGLALIMLVLIFVFDVPLWSKMINVVLAVLLFLLSGVEEW